MAILQQLATAANYTNTHEVQYITMAFIAHDCLLRASELLALRLSDIRWFTDCARLRIRNSKANKLSGRPEFIFLYANDWGLCGLSTLKAYWTRLNLNQATDPDTPLFVSSDGRSPTPKRAWVAYIRGLLQRAGYNPNLYSGHSFRSGGATDIWNSGARPRVIQLFGRWLSDAFWLYIRDNPAANAQEISAAFSRLVQLTDNPKRRN
jgi:integrase